MSPLSLHIFKKCREDSLGFNFTVLALFLPPWLEVLNLLFINQFEFYLKFILDEGELESAAPILGWKWWQGMQGLAGECTAAWIGVTLYFWWLCTDKDGGLSHVLCAQFPTGPTGRTGVWHCTGESRWHTAGVPQPGAATRVSHQVTEAGRDLCRSSTWPPGQSRVSWSSLSRNSVVHGEILWLS